MLNIWRQIHGYLCYLCRFNCFACNYDLCDSCVLRKAGRSVLEVELGQGAGQGGPSAPSQQREEEEPPPPYHQVALTHLSAV